jgi:MFS-type transporter involved in bile tolerance (Atg22 family)
VPLFLSVALGLSAIATGVRLLPLSITLLLAAVGIPKLFPRASPRRVVRFGFVCLWVGIVVFVAALQAGAGPEIVTWPMLLVGLGIGALASQLGSVTVSSVPDEQAGEVGGLQNTVTNLGAGVPPDTANAIVDENSKARLDALRAALAVLALVGLTGWISRRIPTEQPGSVASDDADQ